VDFTAVHFANMAINSFCTKLCQFCVHKPPGPYCIMPHWNLNTLGTRLFSLTNLVLLIKLFPSTLFNVFRDCIGREPLSSQFKILICPMYVTISIYTNVLFNFLNPSS
jgi:hypothetical protein